MWLNYRIELELLLVEPGFAEPATEVAARSAFEPRFQSLAPRALTSQVAAWMIEYSTIALCREIRSKIRLILNV